MNRIIWKGDRFECSSSELEDAKWQALTSSDLRLRDFMAYCDLRLDDFICHADHNITVLKLKEDLSFAELPITKEGTGFNTCFHLGAYAIASMNLGQKLEICAYSFKPLLHPVLFQGLSKWFGDRPAQEVDKNCSYYSGDLTLKCAVNPSLPCKDCSDVSARFNENLFVWRATDLNDYLNHDLMKRLEEIAMRGSGFNQTRQAFASVQESMRSRVVEIPRMTIGIDEGSGQDATAIATGFTTPPPRFEEERQRYTEERRQARIWSQFGGVVVYPQPHRMPIPQELYGIINETE